MTTRSATAVSVAIGAIALVACSKDGRTVCERVGRTGGVLQSYDTVLTIAIQPEALDDTHTFCLSPTELPPQVFGDAYRLDPPVRLNYDAIVSYRGELPDDLSDVNIGRVSQRDFASGAGKWVSLQGCRADANERHVQCIDTELSKFYGLLDRVVGDTSDTVADTSGATGDTSSASDVTMTTVDPTTDTTDPTGIDYPPACDELFRGPYEVIGQGVRFEPSDDGGAEDMAPDGQGGFIARSEGRLVRLDVTGGTLGTEDDPGFTVSELLDSPLFDSPTLGIRYAPSGNLILAQWIDQQVRSMEPDGGLTTLVDDVNVPNGIWVGNDDILWYTEFSANRVMRLDLAAGGEPVQVAQMPQPNGVLYDPLRELLFYASAENGELWRVAVAPDGTPLEAAMVAPLDGAIDGLAKDVCGNLYAVDNGGAVRLLRVFMDDAGVMSEVEEIATGLEDQANAVFGVGAAYGPFATAIFLTGNSGEVEYIDLQIGGAEVPVLSAPPPTVDDTPDTTGTDTGGSTGDATTSTGGT